MYQQGKKYFDDWLAGKLNALWLVFIFVFAIQEPAQAYIGPGAGFAVMGSFLVMFTAVLSALAAFFTWPVRYIIRMIRGRRALARSRVRRFVILGLDGLDPSLTKKYMAEGKLPNLEKLSRQGCFKPLQTTIPSISPVAWSSFQTGSNPGKHSIFDFLTRDKQSYYPKLSSVDIRGPRRKINIGRYQFPLSRPDIRLLRRSKAFWNNLGENGIFSNIIRVPITFPPEKFRGVQLSAMCVPDLRGSQGMFSFYTSRGREEYERIGGEHFQVTVKNKLIKADLVGPANPFRRDNSILKRPFTIALIDDHSADLKVNGRHYRIKKDEYTEWIKIDFKAAPGIKVRGICKFLLKSATPEFELYVTPINIDPEKPVMPISYPPVYSTYFAKQQGPYATLGLAEDTWALNEKILTNKTFLQQCIQFDEEREKMFFDSLDKVKEGLCVCVFDGTDRIQHTFWRYIDKKHPALEETYGEDYPDAVEEVYKRMDAIVGKAMAKCCDEKTVFMVISDHGFASFRYGIDLNRWLEENGYLTRSNGQCDNTHLAAVDWSNTRAFAIGLAGIYLNLKGRESRGIVNPGNEADQLREEISEKLTGLIDSANEKTAVKRVYNTQKIYTGPYKNEAPDLIVGYNRGYRASWETAVGKVTDSIFHENTKAWSGDHCIDPVLVPGVLFCNRPVDTKKPRLIDIGPTVLDMFGVSVPKYMDGKPLTVADSGIK